MIKFKNKNLNKQQKRTSLFSFFFLLIRLIIHILQILKLLNLNQLQEKSIRIDDDTLTYNYVYDYEYNEYNKLIGCICELFKYAVVTAKVLNCIYDNYKEE